MNEGLFFIQNREFFLVKSNKSATPAEQALEKKLQIN